MRKGLIFLILALLLNGFCVECYANEFVYNKFYYKSIEYCYKDTYIVENNNKYGVIDNGNIVIPCDYRKIYYNNGRFTMCKDETWYSFSDNNQTPIGDYLYLKYIDDDLYIALNNQMDYGIVDKNNNIILDFEWGEIIEGNNKTLLLEKDGNYYFINYITLNKIKLNYSYVENIENTDRYIVINDFGYGVIDSNATEIISTKYSSITPYPNNDELLFVATSNVGWHLINSVGEGLYTTDAQFLGNFSENKGFLKKSGELKCIKLDGDILFNADEKITNIMEYSEGIAVAEFDDIYTYISSDGSFIDDMYFDYASSFYGGYAIVAKKQNENDDINTIYDWFIINTALDTVYDVDGQIYGNTVKDYSLKNGYIRVINSESGNMDVIKIGDISSFTYENTKDGICITGTVGTESNIFIPAYIDNKKVVSIAGNAFNNNSTIKSISLPNSEITLEKNAISSCPNLESVYVPNADTVIIDGAISNCPNVTITGKPASTANIYAITNNIAFRATSTQTVRISDVVTDNATGTVHATITNTSGKEFNNIQAIVALYSNGKMTDTKTCDIEKLPNNDSVGISVKFNTNNIYEYKIFLWESLQTIKPISDVYVPDGIMKSTVSATPTPTKKYDVSVSNVTTNIGAKTISATVKNSGNENISDAVVYVAAYDNGKLLEAQQCDIASLNAGSSQNITATFKTNDIDDYKIFVWDSASTLKPLSQVTE